MNTIITPNTANISQDLQVASTTLDLLLLGKVHNIKGNQNLLIPEYQRPYVWKQKQLLQLLEDFLEFVNNMEVDKPMYYLGSIIIHQTEEGFNIIDGQQRLTTMLILNYLIYGEDLSVTYSNPSSISRIKKNYLYLKEIFSGDYLDHIDLIALKNKLSFAEINVTLVITRSEDLAYTFFETQNTGGVRLSGSDIVKAHHLRAVPNKKEVAYQAKRWERNQKNIEQTIDYLTKLRYWDNRYWRIYPFFKDWTGKKNAIIEEFSIDTHKTNKDISYHYQVVEKKDGFCYSGTLSPYKQLRQPLYDGNNTLDYLNEYLKLYVDLFVLQDNYIIDDRFTSFYNQIVVNSHGTVYLKDLWEACVIAFVSKFGYNRLFEVSLWLYRNIYSLRVSLDRNVREDSVFKFVKDMHFIDTILDVYTVDELILKLKKYRYTFNTKYAEEGQSKDYHLTNIRKIFSSIKPIRHYQKNYEFDKDLIASINLLINQ